MKTLSLTGFAETWEGRLKIKKQKALPGKLTGVAEKRRQWETVM